MSYQTLSELCKALLWSRIDHERGERADAYRASDAELEMAESSVGARFPDDYRWFMKHYGMRGLEDPRVNLSIRGYSLSFLGMFSPVDIAAINSQKWSSCDLLGRSIIPSWMLPVADSLSGDALLLDLSAAGYGSVWMRHSLLPPMKWRSDNAELVPIADSFTELIAIIVAQPQMGNSGFNQDEALPL
ncbi:MAG: SMI1/KNR4 family protein [Shewanella sp.]|nr:SMI1/KNR4 family protein [Shewanella sp.]MCF1431592.1 SMI1/KNR4 family protein [Shewanella sp.]MCF1458324.1 SMI1/KNR4 family protein [Shewanella sp.]